MVDVDHLSKTIPHKIHINPWPGWKKLLKHDITTNAWQKNMPIIIFMKHEYLNFLQANLDSSKSDKVDAGSTKYTVWFTAFMNCELQWKNIHKINVALKSWSNLSVIFFVLTRNFQCMLLMLTKETIAWYWSKLTCKKILISLLFHIYLDC